MADCKLFKRSKCGPNLFIFQIFRRILQNPKKKLALMNCKKIQANRSTLPTKQKVIKPTNQIRLIPIKFQKNSLLVSLIYFLATLSRWFFLHFKNYHQIQFLCRFLVEFFELLFAGIFQSWTVEGLLQNKHLYGIDHFVCLKTSGY